MEIDKESPNLANYRSTNETNGSITKRTEAIEIIDITDYQSNSSSKKKRHSSVYDKSLCKDNKALTDFINKCLFLDPTDGMEKVINKVLLTAYVKADKDYKESDKFRRVVTKAFQRLIDDPDRKYTHISNVVDTLKFHARSAPKPDPPVKKRMNFITLSTKVSVKPNVGERKRPMISSSSAISPPKKSKSVVIALDCDDDDDEVIPIEDEAKKDNFNNQIKEIKHKDKSQAQKENQVNDDIDDTIEIQDSQEVKIIEETLQVETDNKLDLQITNIQGNIQHEFGPEKENLRANENLLVPHKEKVVRLEKPNLKKKVPAKMPEEMDEVEKARRVRVIEAKIEKCNKAIAKLDLEEVTDDSANSPYYKCDRLRATIVKLYKELCTLVGEEPPKRRKIQLQIKEGLPEGPIRRLERFLNRQADEDGETPFPDFSDVVRCVEKANGEDSLGWSKAKVMKEAQEIFTYCGRALQKKRQQREWKSLRALARPEEFEADPAERDQELQARLEANRRVASQREAEVFKKFTNMKETPEPGASISFTIAEPTEHDSSSDEEEPAQNNPQELPKETNNNDGTVSNIDDTDVVAKQEPEVPINIQYQGDISLVINISDSESDDECGVLTF